MKESSRYVRSEGPFITLDTWEGTHNSTTTTMRCHIGSANVFEVGVGANVSEPVSRTVPSSVDAYYTFAIAIAGS
jgi:hypothetical protein